jgi:hypothetical protein
MIKMPLGNTSQGCFVFGLLGKFGILVECLFFTVKLRS